MQTNPYKIEPPSLISFSGGRTSAFMLRQILDAHGGTLPDGIHATFANTGKERPETLDFVRECSRRWGVLVSWLEYRDSNHGYEVVNFETASRSGEPFAELIRPKKFLPNPVMRFCTIELKIRVMKKFMLDRGYEEWDVILGLRADEPGRAHRAKLSCSRERWRNVCPMLDAGHTESDVLAFWANQSFDLQLKQYEGNCDLCFLKGVAKIEQILIDRPDLADWWIEQERLTGGTFRYGRPKYAHLLKIVQDQGRFPFADETLDVCNCTD